MRRDDDVEGLFLLCTTWLPRSKARAVEMKLRVCLNKALFELNEKSRTGFQVKSGHEVREIQK